jgi:hypothetical protein
MRHHRAQAVPAWLQRTDLLVGAGNIAKLRDTRVLLVGLGGVGSFAAEFLCRAGEMPSPPAGSQRAGQQRLRPVTAPAPRPAGVGHMTIVDGDVVDVSNKNRQLPALTSTVGVSKAQVMAQRLLDINPELDLRVGCHGRAGWLGRVAGSRAGSRARRSALQGRPGAHAAAAVCAKPGSAQLGPPEPPPEPLLPPPRCWTSSCTQTRRLSWCSRGWTM